MRFVITIFSTFVLGLNVYAQDFISLGAVHKDSSIILSWASECNVTRGFINIEDTTQTTTEGTTTSNRAFFGSPSAILGYPSSNMNALSLGDSGYATLSFDHLIFDGPGPDFVVFENGFQLGSDQYFLELAYVEVSSDGENFVRFPARSDNQSNAQIGGFGGMTIGSSDNLAGAFPTNYGTPFDLEDLADSTRVDIENIAFVRIVDAVGVINGDHTQFDNEGNIINDPWPTPFWSGGFDLTGVGLINQTLGIGLEEFEASAFDVFPNPVKVGSILNLDFEVTSIKVIHSNGLTTTIVNETGDFEIPSNLSPGLYTIQVVENERTYQNRLMVQR